MVDWKRYGLPYCSIYIVAPDGHWPCKIGISNYARKRLNVLQTSHWKRLEVARCFWAPSVNDARRIEKKAHEILKEGGLYLLGEWFDRTPEKAAEVIEFAALTEGVELSEKVGHPEAAQDIAREWEAMIGDRWAIEAEAISASVQGFHTDVLNWKTGKKVKRDWRA